MVMFTLLRIELSIYVIELSIYIPDHQRLIEMVINLSEIVLVDVFMASRP